MIKIICTSSLEKVLPDRTPQGYKKPVTIFANEYFSCQFAVWSDNNRELAFAVTDNGKPHRENYYVKRVPALVNKYIDRDDYVLYNDREDTYYPDVMIGAGDRIDLERDKWTCVRCAFDGKNESVGEHAVIFTGSSDGEKVSARCEFRILPYNLPALDIPYTAWFHYDSLADYYGKEVFCDEYNKIMYRYFENAVAHDMNCLYTPMFSFATNVCKGKYRRNIQLVDIREEEENKYVFSFDRLIKFMKKAEEYGFRYFEMSHLSSQWGASFSSQIFVTKNGKRKRAFGWNVKSTSKKYCGFLAQFLPAVTKALEENDFGGRCFFHVSDEPRPTSPDYPVVARYIKSLLGNFKTLDALSAYDCYEKGLVDIPVVETRGTGAFMEKGVPFWLYYCCTHGVNGYSNRLFNMPLERTRILGIQGYLCDIKGFLHWGYNFYYTSMSEKSIDPYYETDAGGKFPAGDSFIVYPSPEGGVYDSIRHEVFREAWQDYKSLKLLESLKGREFAVGLIAAEGVRGFDVYPHSKEWLLSFREKINALIGESYAQKEKCHA